MKDLDWLARNVHEWPASKDESIRLDHDGEICFRPSSAEFDFYPDDIESAKKAFVPDTDCVLGKEYTYDQWLTRRAELQGKPSFDDHPDALCFAQSGYGWWSKNVKTDDVYVDDEGWASDLPVLQWVDISKGEVLGDWRNTLERRPERKPSDKTAKALEEVGSMNKQWTGPEDGLPPVKMCVEYNDRIQDRWDVVFIVAHHCNGEEALFSESIDGGQIYYGTPSDFRPLRTEEDKAVEEMVAISLQTPMINSLDHIETAHRDACRALYRANYRKLDTPTNND